MSVFKMVTSGIPGLAEPKWYVDLAAVTGEGQGLVSLSEVSPYLSHEDVSHGAGLVLGSNRYFHRPDKVVPDPDNKPTRMKEDEMLKFDQNWQVPLLPAS